MTSDPLCFTDYLTDEWQVLSDLILSIHVMIQKPQAVTLCYYLRRRRIVQCCDVFNNPVPAEPASSVNSLQVKHTPFSGAIIRSPYKYMTTVEVSVIKACRSEEHT